MVWCGEFFGSDQHALAWKRETLAAHHHGTCSILILRAEEIGKRLLIDAQEGVARPCTLTERAPRAAAAPAKQTKQMHDCRRASMLSPRIGRVPAVAMAAGGAMQRSEPCVERLALGGLHARHARRADLQPMRTAMARRVQTVGIRHSPRQNSTASDEDPG